MGNENECLTVSIWRTNEAQRLVDGGALQDDFRHTSVTKGLANPQRDSLFRDASEMKGRICCATA